MWRLMTLSSDKQDQLAKSRDECVKLVRKVADKHLPDHAKLYVLGSIGIFPLFVLSLIIFQSLVSLVSPLMRYLGYSSKFEPCASL